jgi:putative FmdB family regulatory protein
MPVYDFICHKCKLFFEKEYSMKNAPTRSRCPECNKLSNQNYQQVAVHFKGDCYTNRSLTAKANTSKFEQKRLAETLVNKTKESLDTAKCNHFYSNMQPNERFSEEYPEYKTRKLNTREKEEKDRRMASIGHTVDKLGSYHHHQPLRHK